jgi:hypothetical protein
MAAQNVALLRTPVPVLAAAIIVMLLAAVTSCGAVYLAPLRCSCSFRCC